jgi:hypothetical protein
METDDDSGIVFCQQELAARQWAQRPFSQKPNYLMTTELPTKVQLM